MKRKFTFWIPVFVLALGLQSHPWAQNAAPIAADTRQQIDAVFAVWDNTRSPGCALGVSRNGNLVYSHGYGMSNLEYDVPITPDSIFQVGSVSKQFTAFAIALLASESKLALDDDIRRYLPELPDYRQRITLRHLLTHTSGLREQWPLLRLAGWRYADLIRQDDMLRIIARQRLLNFAPGVEYGYSNTGFTLLAVIVERVSGQSLREFAHTRIFEPLGMRETHFSDDHSMIVKRRTSAYEPRRGGGWRISLPVLDANGATNLFTTVGDMLKWQQNFVDAGLGGRALLDQMQTPERLNDGSQTNYGFGLRVGAYRGQRTVGHSGWDFGYKSDVVQFPDAHLAIAVFCNFSNVVPGVLARKVAEIVLGEDAFEPLPPSISMTQTELAAFAGTYWDSHTDSMWRIGVQDGQLRMGGTVLAPLGGGRFRVGERTGEEPCEQPIEVIFPLSQTGGPQELRLISTCATAVLERVTAPLYSAADLTRYVGEYRSDELDVSVAIVVAMPEGRLAAELRRFEIQGPIPLAEVKPDTFVGASLGRVTFVRGPSDDVVGFTLSTGGVRRLPFMKAGLTSPVAK